MPEPTLHAAGPVDLDALDAFLLSDRAPEGSMGLSDLDGFLAGIAVGPELVMPSEWLPVVWGGAEPAFERVEEARSILGTIMGRYNEVVRALGAAPDEFDPLFWEGPDDGRIVVIDWASGFLDAGALRPDAWGPLIRHSEAGVLMLPLLVLGADDPERPPFGARPPPGARSRDCTPVGRRSSRTARRTSTASGGNVAPAQARVAADGARPGSRPGDGGHDLAASLNVKGAQPRLRVSRRL